MADEEFQMLEVGIQALGIEEGKVKQYERGGAVELWRSRPARVYFAGGVWKTIITPPFQKAPQSDQLTNSSHYRKRKSRSSDPCTSVASCPSLFPSDTQ